MTFKDIEEIRKSKGLRNWQMAYLLGLRPKSEIKTPRIIYCGAAYQDLKKGRYNIDLNIIIAATAVAQSTPEKIKKELSKIK